ncbi:hypothetical protein [Microbacterium lacus]|uniref:hypothetical protein n=1 Tax=Microbacterium lacus TaxID=415217 RepID=UPI000C2BE08D|nr:hypothetical protein [Microbacterium lacus]
MSDLMLDIDGVRFDGMPNGLRWIAKDGLDGWWDSAETTEESELLGDDDGEHEDVDVFVGGRRVNLDLWVESSSSDWAEKYVRRWASALSKKRDLRFRVFHAGEWLSLRNARIRGKATVMPQRFAMNRTRIQMTVRSADPRKYGAPDHASIDATASVSGGLEFPLMDGSLDFSTGDDVDFPGVFRIENPGTAPFFPWFRVTGPMDRFTITTETHVIEYDGPVEANEELILSPHIGGRALLDGVDVSHNMTRADWVPVDGGTTRGYLLTPENPRAGAQLTYEFWRGTYW